METKFYGKRIVIAGFLVAAFTMAIINTTATFYMAPICKEFGFTIAGFSWVYSMASLGAAIGSILAGSLIAKFNIRVVMSVGAVATAAFFSSLGLAKELWHFYLLLGLADLCMGIMAVVPLSVMVANWYTDNRGLMTAVVFSGVGVGGVILSPLVENLITNMGWRSSLLISSLIILVTSLPLCLFVFIKDPASVGQTPYVQPAEKKKATKKPEELGRAFEGITKSQALRTSSFYMLALGLFLLGILASGIMVHIPTYLYSIGMVAGTAMAVLSAATIIGRLGSGFLFDKIGAIGGMLFATVFFVIGLVSLVFIPNASWLLYLMPIAVGFSICVSSVAPPLFTSIMFGTKEYSQIFGLQYALFLVGCIAGPVLSGYIYTGTGSYSTVWLAFVGITLAMFVCTSLAVVSARSLRKIGVGEGISPVAEAIAD